MRTISVKLTRELDEALTRIARQRKSTRSTLIREAVEVLAINPRRSVTAMVDELGAALDGPTDLSTNEKRLAGYGR